MYLNKIIKNWIRKVFKNGEYYGSVKFMDFHAKKITIQHGYGIMRYNDGSIYEGTFADGLRYFKLKIIYLKGMEKVF